MFSFLFVLERPKTVTQYCVTEEELNEVVQRQIAMGALYRLSGFLHWGFNYYIGDDIWNSACCPHKGALLPAGDAPPASTR